MGTYCFGHGCGLWMLWLYFGVARVMIICLARICISSDIRVLIYTIVSVEKYYIVLLPTYNDPLSSSHQTIFLSSLSHHAAPVFLTAFLTACACFSIVSHIRTYAVATSLLLCARVLASNDTLVSYVGIICSWFCSLHDWFHDSRSSQSAPAMMFFYKNKTSAVTLIKQFHACNYKFRRFLRGLRVWTP